MISIRLLLYPLIFLIGFQSCSTENEWLSLFNGKDLNGWKVIGDQEWNVVDGAIITEATGMDTLTFAKKHLFDPLGIEDIVLLRTGKGTLSDAPFKHLPTEKNLTTALERWNPGAVVISNPTSMHMEVALTAVKAGCSVLQMP